MMYDFHIFAHDCLRRIYILTERPKEASNIVDQMKNLLNSNERSRSFIKYFDLLDSDIATVLKFDLQLPLSSSPDDYLLPSNEVSEKVRKY